MPTDIQSRSQHINRESKGREENRKLKRALEIFGDQSIKKNQKTLETKKQEKEILKRWSQIKARLARSS